MGLKSQNINGYIVSDTGNLTVVKVWGNHYERGFAYGYLCAAKIIDMMNNYVIPQFGSYLPQARLVIQQGTSLIIDSVYYQEARGVIDGMDSSGQNIGSLSYLDILVANCLLDLASIAGLKADMGCSSLMSWGAATAGTDLNGKSVISRHLDWAVITTLINNQVIVVHIPSEPDEQPWALIGFAGQISALSGINRHMGVFQQMMSDFSGNGSLYQGYEPTWFSIRKALEKADYNNDGVNNTKDMCDILSAHTMGYADGYIITMLAASTNTAPGLIAQVAEVAPYSPTITLRGSEFPDSIQSDNLYAANYEIKRNNHYHFCLRYIRSMHGVDNGLNIGTQRNWQILRDSSNSGPNNIQLMQYIPDDKVLNISVYKHGKAAYRNNPVTLDMSDLFTNTSVANSKNTNDEECVLYPNPVKQRLYITIPDFNNKVFGFEIFDINGKKTDVTYNYTYTKGHIVIQANTGQLKTGIYTCRFITGNFTTVKKFIKTY